MGDLSVEIVLLRLRRSRELRLVENWARQIGCKKKEESMALGKLLFGRGRAGGGLGRF